LKKLNIKNCRIIELPKIGDDIKGFLSFGEAQRKIPFEIKRIYYIYGIKDSTTVRGKHAHKKLEQILFCLHGSVTFLLDDGEKKIKIKLNKPNKGLYIGPWVWHDMMDFSNDVVILTIASNYYEEEDYIRNYDKFINYIQK
jgi:dTDP-4-dehydrorhamnose 3,5-epimerase-like enzyme